MKTKLSFLLILLIAIGGLFLGRQLGSRPAASQSKADSLSQTKTVGKTVTAKPNACQSATTQTIIVSLSQQHMWACSGTKEVYDNAVITGMVQYDDSTPLGSYKIYSKLTDQDLKGCDPTGCWDDHVSYWLPYQQAGGGTVGFHDATWRQPTDFGSITPASNKGSHGCVEMPLAAAKWLYGWAAIGTTVSIIS